MTAFLGLLRKELIQFFRDRLMLGLILWLYTAEVIICSAALTFEVENLPLAVANGDDGAAGRALLQRFDASGGFDLIQTGFSPAAAVRHLESGEAAAVLVIPAGFSAALAAGRVPALQVLVDGSDSNTAANALQNARGIIDDFAGERGGVPAAAALPLTRVWYNPQIETARFIVLSMIALAGMMVGIIHPAASVVREKEQGTIEQLLVTPLTTLQLFAAKVIPTLLMGLLSVFPSLLIASLFEVPLRGSLVLFLALTALFLLSAVALGVLIAAYSRTLQQALLLAFFGLFPIMFLSGSLTPVDAMPPFLQALSLLSPLRHYMEITTGIFLKGAGWAQLKDEALALAVLGAPLFGLALVVFRRRVA
jgi:ABC-2 type transport system permease protein